MIKPSRNEAIRALLAAFFFATLGASVCTGQDQGRRDTDFKITFLTRKEFPPGYDANLESTAIYPCTGYNIRTGISWNRDTLNIDIGGFRTPSPCVSLPAPATGLVYLGNIGSGTYILRIRYRGDEDLHRLTLKNGSGKFKSIRSAFTDLRWK